MQAKKIEYDVITLTEMRRRHLLNVVYVTEEELFLRTCGSRGFGGVGVLVNMSMAKCRFAPTSTHEEEENVDAFYVDPEKLCAEDHAFHNVIVGIAFIIQFAVCYLLAAIPMLYLEIAMGQFTSASPFSVYQMMSPAMGGIPAAISFLLVIKSVAISVWACEALVFFIVSLTGSWRPLPWTTCRGIEDCYDHRLAKKCMFASPNETACADFIRAMVVTRSDHIKNSPLATYFREIIQQEDNLSAEKFLPHPFLIISLFVVWFMACGGASVGIRYLSKTAYIVIALAFISTATFVAVKFASACSVGSISNSISHFLNPRYKLLLSVEKWILAAGHALMALSVSTGAMIKLASARPFRMAIVWDVVIIAVVVALYYALTLLSIVMFMEKFAAELYPFDNSVARFDYITSHRFMATAIMVEVFMSMPYPWLLSALHFFARLFIPMQTVTTNMWVVVTMLREKYADATRKHLSRLHVWMIIVALGIFGYIVSFQFIMPGNNYLLFISVYYYLFTIDYIYYYL
ncbi:hypothetical protein NECAME_14100 [Necator americanus]|uniref:Sodium:neurotransmitter symporter family protein n=1 Tax=Necator americanus TaxID=51031 RepID=W2SPZ8_NECAM|nr:hypothetical protein NECAME_14100 [Necator americanus]ETN71769.1 hypothetical protein NECAME_14100 [Necator americanus]